MRGVTVAVTVVCLLFFIIPVIAVTEDKYGYITVKDMNITLEQGRAYIDIHYTLDEPTRLIVLLFQASRARSRSSG